MTQVKTHPLAGRPQSPEHIRKRVESIARTKATWSPERMELHRQRASESNKAGTPESRQKNSDAHRGRTPWNKGNNWRAAVGEVAARAINAARARVRRASKPKYRLNERMRTRIRTSLKGKKGGRSWESLVGYSCECLEAHLRTTMPAGYGWADFMSGALEIDHIRPIASFRFNDVSDPDFIKCWSLENLRLLPAEENHRKRDKWPCHTD